MKSTIGEHLKTIAEALELAPIEEVLTWGMETYGANISLACSLGPEDLVLIHHIHTLNLPIKAFFLDTDLHFPETYELKEKIEEHYGFKLDVYNAHISLEEQNKIYGPSLFTNNPDHCCQIRKVEPLEHALHRLSAWMTGIRREQSPTRANTPIIQWDSRFNLIKINPLVNWTNEDIWSYIHSKSIPYNSLHDKNYPSIGCAPCTNPVSLGENSRSGRWQGFNKTECGLHQGENSYE